MVSLVPVERVSLILPKFKVVEDVFVKQEPCVIYFLAHNKHPRTRMEDIERAVEERLQLITYRSATYPAIVGGKLPEPNFTAVERDLISKNGLNLIYYSSDRQVLLYSCHTPDRVHISNIISAATIIQRIARAAIHLNINDSTSITLLSTVFRRTVFELEEKRVMEGGAARINILEEGNGFIVSFPHGFFGDVPDKKQHLRFLFGRNELFLEPTDAAKMVVDYYPEDVLLGAGVERD